jgi:hypothetical protein
LACEERGPDDTTVVESVGRTTMATNELPTAPAWAGSRWPTGPLGRSARRFGADRRQGSPRRHLASIGPFGE